MEMEKGIKNFLGDLLAVFVGEFFTISALKNILSKGTANKTVPGKTAEGEKTPDIKFGGVFDLSDETAYFGLITKMEADPCLKDGAIKISEFINGPNFQTNGQKRRFRVIVGSLANIE